LNYVFNKLQQGQKEGMNKWKEEHAVETD